VNNAGGAHHVKEPGLFERMPNLLRKAQAGPIGQWCQGAALGVLCCVYPTEHQLEHMLDTMDGMP
jgi:hypothetical protein